MSKLDYLEQRLDKLRCDFKTCLTLCPLAQQEWNIKEDIEYFAREVDEHYQTLINDDEYRSFTLIRETQRLKILINKHKVHI